MVENWTASKHLPLKRGVEWTAHVLLIPLYMVAAAGAHLGLKLAPFVTLLSAYVRESLLDAGLHAFESADVYVGGRGGRGGRIRRVLATRSAMIRPSQSFARKVTPSSVFVAALRSLPD